MSKFIEINKVNSFGERGKALLRTDFIVGIKEKHVEPTRLYDRDGNVVSETPSPKDYTVYLQYGDTFHIDEDEYNRLLVELTKE